MRKGPRGPPGTIEAASRTPQSMALSAHLLDVTRTPKGLEALGGPTKFNGSSGLLNQKTKNNNGQTQQLIKNIGLHKMKNAQKKHKKHDTNLSSTDLV